MERFHDIATTLDSLKIEFRDFHRGNFMEDKKGQIYIIDYGMALDHSGKKKRVLNRNVLDMNSKNKKLFTEEQSDLFYTVRRKKEGILTSLSSSDDY
jgi:predicted unusual protein kinase regulating ubiquinone biosynthesis (AarF/ABC1/UbiB family)